MLRAQQYAYHSSAILTALQLHDDMLTPESSKNCSGLCAIVKISYMVRWQVAFMHFSSICPYTLAICQASLNQS